MERPIIMRTLESPIKDVSVIIAVEKAGPILKASTSNDILSHISEAKVVLYFTQRIVFSIGFGNKQVEFDKIHGPITLLETRQPQEALMLPTRLNDPESSDPRIVNSGRDIVFVFHYLETERKIVQKFDRLLGERCLVELKTFCPGGTYSCIREEKKLSELVHLVKARLNRLLGLRIWAEENAGSSLLHLGTLNSLSGPHRALGAVLVGASPHGMKLEEIAEKLRGSLASNEIADTVDDLIEMGFLQKV